MCNLIKMHSIYSSFIGFFNKLIGRKESENNQNSYNVASDIIDETRHSNFQNTIQIRSQKDAKIHDFNNNNKQKESNQWNIDRILSNRMLTDNEIYASLQILKNQFSTINNLHGFYDPQSMNAKQTKKFKFFVEYPNRFIQILHDGDMHWYTLTNINSKHKYQVQAYDSFFMNKTYINNEYLVRCLRKLLKPSDIIDLTDNIHVECSIEPVQKQSDSTLCGLFAIAFIIDICLGKNPINLVYDEFQMRQHLYKCLNQNYFDSFPIAKHSVVNKNDLQIIFIEI